MSSVNDPTDPLGMETSSAGTIPVFGSPLDMVPLSSSSSEVADLLSVSAIGSAAGCTHTRSTAGTEVDLLAYHDPQTTSGVDLLSPDASFPLIAQNALIGSPQECDALLSVQPIDANSDPYLIGVDDSSRLLSSSRARASSTTTVGRFEVLDQDGSPASSGGSARRTPNSARGGDQQTPNTPIPFAITGNDTTGATMTDTTTMQSVPVNAAVDGPRALQAILEESITKSAESLTQPIDMATQNGTLLGGSLAAADDDSSSSDDDSSTGSQRSLSPITTPPASTLSLPMSPNATQDTSRSVAATREKKSGRFSVVEFQDDIASPTPPPQAIQSALPPLSMLSASPPSITSVAHFGSVRSRGILDLFSSLQSEVVASVEENDFLRREVVQLVSHLFLLRGKLEAAIQGQLAVDVAQEALQTTELSPQLIQLMTRMTLEAKQNAQAQVSASNQPRQPASTPTSTRTLQPSAAQQSQPTPSSAVLPSRVHQNITPSPANVSRFFADYDNASATHHTTQPHVTQPAGMHNAPAGSMAAAHLTGTPKRTHARPKNIHTHHTPGQQQHAHAGATSNTDSAHAPHHLNHPSPQSHHVSASGSAVRPSPVGSPRASPNPRAHAHTHTHTHAHPQRKQAHHHAAHHHHHHHGSQQAAHSSSPHSGHAHGHTSHSHSHSPLPSPGLMHSHSSDGLSKSRRATGESGALAPVQFAGDPSPSPSPPVTRQSSASLDHPPPTPPRKGTKQTNANSNHQHQPTMTTTNTLVNTALAATRPPIGKPTHHAHPHTAHSSATSTAGGAATRTAPVKPPASAPSVPHDPLAELATKCLESI